MVHKLRRLLSASKGGLSTKQVAWILFLSVVYLSASLSKMFYPSQVESFLKTTNLFPQSVPLWLGPGVIYFEFAVGLGLLFPHSRFPALVSSILLSAGFIAVDTLRSLAGDFKTCGCFGPLISLDTRLSLGLSILLLSISLILVIGMPVVNTSAVTKSADLKSAALASTIALSSIVCATALTFRTLKLHELQPSDTNLTKAQRDLIVASLEKSQLSREGRPEIIFFGDYQCSPCRQADAEIEQLNKDGQLPYSVVFKNLPLVSIHPFAYQAAVIAEEARTAGSFGPVHAQLMVSDLGHAMLSRIEKSIARPDRSVAKERVERDLALAQSVGLEATPSFVVLTENGAILATSLANAIREADAN